MPGPCRIAASLVALAAWAVPAGSRAQPVEVALWHSYRAAEQTALEQTAERFNASQSRVHLSLQAVPYEAFGSKLAAAIPHGHGPDLFIYAHERTGSFVRQKLVSPVDAEAQARSSAFVPAAADALRFEGHSYGLPLAFKSVALFYNRDLVPVAPRTTDELRSIAARLSNPKEGRYGLAYAAADFYLHAAWLHGFGGTVFDSSHRPALFNPQAVAALAFAEKLVRAEHIVPPETSGALIAELFNSGRAAMAISGPWFLGEIKPGLPYAVAPLPVVSETGLPARPFLTSEGLFLSARAAHPAEAMEAMRFLCSDEAARIRLEVGRQTVANIAAYAQGAPPELEAFRRQAEQAIPMDNSPQMRSVWEPMKGALSAVLRGSSTPQEALKLAQHRMEILARAAPPPASPWPWLLGLSLGSSALIGYLLWRRPWGPKQRSSPFASIFLAPAALGTLVLFGAPMAYGIALALFHHQDGAYTFVGLGNFADILFSRDFPLTAPPSFYYAFAVTLLWTAANVALHLLLGLALALLLRNPLLKLRGVYRVLLIIPWAVPNYVTALVWKGMFHAQFGAINGLLRALGAEPVSWFSRFSTSFAANLATNVWLGFPFMMVVALGGLQSIPQNLYEAAMVDGASGLRRLWHITMPLLKPTLLPAVLLGSMWTFNMFNIVFLVSGGEPNGETDILISEAYRWAFARQEQYGYAAAYSVLIFGILYGANLLTKRLAAPREAT